MSPRTGSRFRPENGGVTQLKVWDLHSPTGVKLNEEFCKETFGHSDGRAWARVLYNPKVHKAPKKLRDGEWYPTTKDRLRAYLSDPAGPSE